MIFRSLLDILLPPPALIVTHGDATSPQLTNLDNWFEMIGLSAQHCMPFGYNAHGRFSRTTICNLVLG